MLFGTALFGTMVFMLVFCIRCSSCANILMITMGGTKSHKIPFLALAKGLIPRGHRITFLNGFPSDCHEEGLTEVTPDRLVNYIRDFTDWDLIGARFSGRTPITIKQALSYPVEACHSLLSDVNIVELLTQKYQLAIVDGAFPECALGIVHRLDIPFAYINTVGFYTGSLAMAGNPIAYAVTPHVLTSFTHSMDFLQRVRNYGMHLLAELLHTYSTHQVHAVLRAHFGESTPHPYTLARNVSLILQNGHAAVTYPRPQLPNVAEIACIHCRPAAASGQLLPELERFVDGAPAGVILFSMGSSVRAVNMPEEFRKLLMDVFARLPRYHILCKWERGVPGNRSQIVKKERMKPIAETRSNVGDEMYEIPTNVYLSEWLPQQDLLGHRKLKAFITHGGLLSMYEAIYHRVPMVVLPVFCDHDVNAAKATADGYAVTVPLESMTADVLYTAITKVLQNSNYRRAVRRRHKLIVDQMTTPLETAIFWTEYILRHKGAEHLQSPSRHFSFFVYYSLDVVLVAVALSVVVVTILRVIFRRSMGGGQQRTDGRMAAASKH